MSKKNIPDWLLSWVNRALLGEIYSEVRAIAIGFDDRVLTVRYYLDHQPNDDDYESISCVVTDIFANTSSSEEITDVIEEAVYTKEPLRELDNLDGFVFVRKEG